ncbi:hypothetical protein D3C86_1044030 [compost metagenome]
MKPNEIGGCGRFGLILSLNPSPKRETKFVLRTGIPHHSPSHFRSEKERAAKE